MAAGKKPANGNGAARASRLLQLVGGGAVALTSVIAILWYVFSAANDIRVQSSKNVEVERRLAQIESALNQINSRLAAIESFDTGQGARNADVDRRTESMDGRVSALTIDVASIKRDLNEVETQFCEADHLRNIMHATDLRWIAAIWEKVFGGRLATDNSYYPIICNRKATAQ